ncbi:hypothetical protein F2P81_020400 [Scophthalmus maximus]|uniref:Uncharacterized protein n=1 Tax=Scophthalmus maximus TaxID=52904 RepID=A0A6A4S540_SCOMX|nr:hypothetical protein F2P81_020400 [Scophthalmus maximus]
MSESPDARSLLSASSQLNLMEVDTVLSLMSPDQACAMTAGSVVSKIDDKEFDIPQVDTPPTLESILNEVENTLQYCITHCQQSF